MQKYWKRMGHMKVPNSEKKRDTMKVSRIYKKWRAYEGSWTEKKIAMSQIQKLEREILFNKEYELHQKVLHTRALFWSKSMMLSSGMVQDLTWQHIQGKSASQCSSIPKTPDKLSRGRMISNMPWKEPLTKFRVTWENHSSNKMPYFL
jgi:hypothetical protein